MFLNIQICLITLKAYDEQFTLTTKNHCISSLSTQLLLYMLLSSTSVTDMAADLRPVRQWEIKHT